MSNSSRCSTRRCWVSTSGSGGMYALTRLLRLAMEKPGNQQHQCPDNQRIEQNEPDTVTLHQRYIQMMPLLTSARFVSTRKTATVCNRTATCPQSPFLPMRRVTCPSKYLQPAGRQQKHPLRERHHTHRTPFVIARFWLVNTGRPSTSRKERESIWEQ